MQPATKRPFFCSSSWRKSCPSRNSKNLMWSPSGNYFHKKRHLWVKKYKSSKIMVNFKGDAFEKKVSPSVNFDPNKSNPQLFWQLLKVTLFLPFKNTTLLYSLLFQKYRMSIFIFYSSEKMILCILHESLKLKTGHTKMTVFFKRVNYKNISSQQAV